MSTATNKTAGLQRLGQHCAVLLGCLAVFAHGQSAKRPPAPQFSLAQLRFSPINPAARPAGLGGAFIGVANDATAAAINPAGVAYLARPEISMSQAWGRSTRDFPDHATSDKSASSLRFNGTLVNIIYPFKGFTFALYHQLAFRSQFKFEREQFLTFAASRPLTLHEQLGAAGNFPGLRSEFFFEVWQDAFVIAKTLKRRLRLGAALRSTQLRLNLQEHHYFAPELWLQSEPSPRTVAQKRANGLYRIYHAQRDEFRAAWNIGLLYELDKRLTLGAVYHRLPSYTIDHLRTLPAYSLPDRTPNDGRDEALQFPAEEVHTPFQLDLPDNWGLGLSWKAGGNNLVALDVVFHRSRSLLQGAAQILPQDDIMTETGEYLDPDNRVDLESEELFSVHAGVEHVLLWSQAKMPLRVGIYNEPVFGLHASANDANLRREYPKPGKRWHLAGGTGLIIKNFRFEMSLDFATTSVEAIGSAVVSF
ncbi:outer membrane protein transport protein [candidate division KSB1 bacterium]|nr:outer membrane protein transport protein [candidate division KSB1 bacterium]